MGISWKEEVALVTEAAGRSSGERPKGHPVGFPRRPCEHFGSRVSAGLRPGARSYGSSISTFSDALC